MSGVGVICFAASYLVAFALEVSRLVFRSGVRGAVMLAFAGAGLVAHSAYLYYRAVNTAGSPLSSAQDWYMLAAWALVAVYLYLVYYHPHTAFGLFLLPVALGLVAVGKFIASPEPFAREPASRAWGIIHGTSLLMTAVAVSVGFVAGLMYLSQTRRLKHKLPPIRGMKLPSLEWLGKVNSRAIVVSALTLGIGLVSGIILQVIGSHEQDAALPWSDPVVLSTGLMFGWLLFATIVGVLYRPTRKGHKVASLTVVSFVFLVIALAIGLLGKTQHGGGDESGTKKTQGEAVQSSTQGSAHHRPTDARLAVAGTATHYPLSTNHYPLLPTSGGSA